MTTPDDTVANEDGIDKLKQALKADFNSLYVREFTTTWEAEQMVRGIEIDVMQLEKLEKYVAAECQRARIDENRLLKEAMRDPETKQWRADRALDQIAHRIAALSAPAEERGKS